KKKIMSLVGTLQWFRPFVPNMSKKLLPITDKLKLGTFTWNETDTQTVTNIIEEIKTKTLMSYPEPSSPYQLYTDASDAALGSVLMQNDAIIGFFSYKLSGSELNYTVCEKECLAIIKSMLFFRTIIYGSKITVFTDSRNITFMKDMNSNRIQRWISVIRDFNYTLEHIRGDKNVVADFLSRNHNLKKSFLIKPNYNILSEIAKFPIDSTKKHLIPDNEISRIIYDAHLFLGHPGFDSLYNTLNPTVSNSNLKKIVNEICSNCIVCKQIKHQQTNQWKYIGDLVKSEPGQTISTDISGPFYIEPKNDIIHKIWILTATDLCTRYTKIAIVFDIKGVTIADAFENIWLNCHDAKSVLSDNGRQYTSKEFKQLLSKYGIKHMLSTPYNPRGNSKSERINKVINEILRFTRIGYKIDEIKTLIENRLNFIFNRSIQCAPIEIAKALNLLGNPSTHNKTLLLERSIIHSRKLAEKDKIRINEKKKPLDIFPNDLIFIKRICHPNMIYFLMGLL
ncbi:putative transposable element, partial [Pseudoloma neurophilia]